MKKIQIMKIKKKNYKEMTIIYNKQPKLTFMIKNSKILKQKLL